ncbi:hypothetical protein H2198_005486 [Neophaeococcomyces mojaviensis]|uniref:Uncharacterized protein n=1 Tax=Neophaeococcomyces mojaviensis TaxID=3383035 RepID=A0ACC3A5H0_9EURO|nr:hypothetical protein H2198_005486 [Knufia sp. JES_112]
MSLAVNNLLTLSSHDRICTAFGIKIVTGSEIVHIAKSAGYDSLFIDLEHTTLSLRDAGQQCITAISAGITPFVRVPHQCGDGFIQRVLDMGAMGVIIPHIHTVDDARRAIRISKYPPMGKRSITGGLPQYQMTPVPASKVQKEVNESGSTVFIMIETVDALDNVDAIAALPGCDVLLIGCNDLAMEIGCAGDWDAPKFRNALRKVGVTCRKHRKIFGIAGVYTRPDLMDVVISEYGARWIVGAQDVTLLVSGSKANVDILQSMQRSEQLVVNGKNGILES